MRLITSRATATTRQNAAGLIGPPQVLDQFGQHLRALRGVLVHGLGERGVDPGGNGVVQYRRGNVFVPREVAPPREAFAISRGAAD